jgi:hypothetical protein
VIHNLLCENWAQNLAGTRDQTRNFAGKFRDIEFDQKIRAKFSSFSRCYASDLAEAAGFNRSSGQECR